MTNTKLCKCCGIVKDRTEFPVHSKVKNTVRKQCYVCYRALRKVQYQEKIEDRHEHNRRSYQRHREKRIAQVAEYNKNNPDKFKKWQKTTRRKALAEFLEFKKTLKCENCGEDDPNCLDFHHTDPETKKANVTSLRFSRGILKKEIDKCIVLCSNCHRKYHNQEIK